MYIEFKIVKANLYCLGIQTGHICNDYHKGQDSVFLQGRERIIYDKCCTRGGGWGEEVLWVLSVFQSLIWLWLHRCLLDTYSLKIYFICIVIIQLTKRKTLWYNFHIFSGHIHIHIYTHAYIKYLTFLHLQLFSLNNNRA